MPHCNREKILKRHKTNHQHNTLICNGKRKKSSKISTKNTEINLENGKTINTERLCPIPSRNKTIVVTTSQQNIKSLEHNEKNSNVASNGNGNGAISNIQQMNNLNRIHKIWDTSAKQPTRSQLYADKRQHQPIEENFIKRMNGEQRMCPTEANGAPSICYNDTNGNKTIEGNNLKSRSGKLNLKCFLVLWGPQYATHILS